MLLALLLVCAKANAAPTYQVLSYHDVVASRAPNARPEDVDAAQLAAHFKWLRENGYHVISVQQLLDARAGKASLPEKAIMLTFDDGYKSFYEVVFPLLKFYGYPATLAVIGNWLDTPAGRDNILTPAQLRELADSGLIEIGSHSYDLHKGVLGNPQGNEMPAAITRIYDPVAARYENDHDYVARIEGDLDKNNRLIARLTGKRARVMVWPYGRYNGTAQQIARRLGLEVMMGLDDGGNDLGAGLQDIHRFFLVDNPTPAELNFMINERKPHPMRVMHVDLDYIYDKDPAQMERNLGAMLERIKTSEVSFVFLQAFADDDASGEAKRLYFPNRHLPVKADLFSRVSWQISTRTKARVFAWLPLMAFVPPESDPISQHKVVSFNGKSMIPYKRLTPFSAEVRKYVKEIYEDLGKYAPFDGLIFHDDASLSDFEDASPYGLDFYKNVMKLPGSIEEIHAKPEYKWEWMKAKTAHLSWFANDLKASTEAYRKPLQTARNYYAEPIMKPRAEEWFAQSLADAVNRFDWVAVMAMPYMEKAAQPRQWLEHMVDIVKAVPGADKKVVFELQAKNWETDKPVPLDELVDWMKMLRAKGVQNYGYYPDDPFSNHPDIGVLRQQISRKVLQP
ncbi:poly-beta-1,6-N-acetyl-D-glucosamine N-deacetylase PgaB [Massilia sp. TS11]|uniref:poly-beta-1,6-N-acetyl-D-glucosamine N-deacetylase PgaB n=1 Tax=Massilia sp. TS11 TaxID=2908003 RepID=UPI001EDC6A32|nr:poly-beta-1,6-N-acetyl-D-glucosamine N-deacetylase PgaB [Massilia sp. TS11]MCG2586077.1 poly-beta-1,6-N-acetyl-D-glucosamine N-deacetylase PgaB [Massilia sp. TS11]